MKAVILEIATSASARAAVLTMRFAFIFMALMTDCSSSTKLKREQILRTSSHSLRMRFSFCC